MDSLHARHAATRWALIRAACEFADALCHEATTSPEAFQARRQAFVRAVGCYEGSEALQRVLRAAEAPEPDSITMRQNATKEPV